MMWKHLGVMTRSLKRKISQHQLNHRFNCRTMTSSNNSGTIARNFSATYYFYPRPKHIPAPTWSIADLGLTCKQPPLPQEELERLSRLALIDIKNRSEAEKELLNQDLANMLHMVKQVTDFANVDYKQTSRINTIGDSEDPFCCSQIYDMVRGVTAAPLRKNIEEDPLHEEDAKQAKEVWESLLQPMTNRKGGSYQYFTIATGDEEGRNTKTSRS